MTATVSVGLRPADRLFPVGGQLPGRTAAISRRDPGPDRTKSADARFERPPICVPVSLRCRQRLVDSGEVLDCGGDGDRGRDEDLSGQGAERADGNDAADRRGRDEWPNRPAMVAAATPAPTIPPRTQPTAAPPSTRGQLVSRTAMAALCPGMPLTPPPRIAPAPQRKTFGTSVATPQRAAGVSALSAR